MTINYRLISTSGDFFYNPLTLVDITQPDQPLVYVNTAFSQLTGYPPEEILGRNCRFLQGPLTDPSDIKHIHQAIADQQAIFCDLLNYHKSGQEFYNRLVLLPILIDKKPHFIGMQIDASALIGTKMCHGKSLDKIKTSEIIKAKIANPLTNIWTVLSMTKSAPADAEILHRAFTEILTTVKAIPFLLN